MLAVIIVVPIALHAALAGPPRARVPADVPMSGLLELTRQGEVALLPIHDASPFNAILLTRSRENCEQVAHEMLDVETWPTRWNIADVDVDLRTATSVRYSIKLGIAFVPRIPGFIEHPTPDRVVFNDEQTGAQFIWTLDTLPEGGCAMRYSLLETPGKASGWVAVLKALESSTVDAGNFAAALSTARGFTKPEETRPVPTPGAPTAGGEGAFAALAQHGTALRLIRADGKFPVIVVRRVVERPVDEVLWAIRDKKRYEDKIEVISKVKDHGQTAEYTVGAFGGRVTWKNDVTETGDAHTPDGITFTERVATGDLSRGSWQWRVRPVPGGTDVQLTWDLDITTGSSIMSTLAETDPVARESMALHMALALIGELVGGKPVGQRTLAKVP